MKERKGEEEGEEAKVFRHPAKVAANTIKGRKNCTPTLKTVVAAWQSREHFSILLLEAYVVGSTGSCWGGDQKKQRQGSRRAHWLRREPVVRLGWGAAEVQRTGR